MSAGDASAERAAVRGDLLRRLLTTNWLRPENALWYAHMLEAANRVLGHPIAAPALELGAMDGVATFVMLGGEFAPQFDIYSEVTWTKSSIHWQSLRDDYFNAASMDGAAPPVVRRPSQVIDVGINWKRAHVDKASRLDLYRRLIECDPNQPMTMLEDESFATIWAPNLYWMDNLSGVLAELRRVLSRRGRLVTIVPDAVQLQHMIYRFADRADVEWLRDLDRGRYENTRRHARSADEWQAVFHGSGFGVTRHERFIPALVNQVYDIGLRPLFPVLMHMHESLRECSAEKLQALKDHWVETMGYFLRPLCDTAWMERIGGEYMWHVFELRRERAAA